MKELFEQLKQKVQDATDKINEELQKLIDIQQLYKEEREKELAKERAIQEKQRVEEQIRMLKNEDDVDNYVVYGSLGNQPFRKRVKQSQLNDETKQPFNPNQPIRVKIPIKMILHKQQRRQLDIFLQDFSSNMLDYVNTLLYNNQFYIFNKCVITAFPNFQIYSPVNLHFLNNIQATSSKARIHLANHQEEYMIFLRKCFRTPGSCLNIELDLIQDGVQILGMKYVVSQAQGFYFKLSENFETLKQVPLVITNRKLIEDFLFGLEMDEEYERFQQLIEKNGGKEEILVELQGDQPMQDIQQYDDADGDRSSNEDDQLNSQFNSYFDYDDDE